MSAREVKVCLLGDVCVGKSSLVYRLVNNSFNGNISATVGATFMTKSLTVDNTTVKFQIWDTAGQERYRSLMPMFYRNAAAAIVVYDITSEATFKVVQVWIDELHRLGPPNIVLAIAGNKCDLEDKREVSYSRGEEYAATVNAIFRETSALKSTNVEEVFIEISRKLPPEQISSFHPRGRSLLQVEEKKKCKCSQ